MENNDAPVLVRRKGALAHLILNRPRAMNALTHEMVRLMSAALTEWADDTTVETIVLTGSGDRALCAGGDIVAIYHDALGDGGESASFWADEYALNAQINAYPKPFVAVMDGVVLGGGVGVSAHASHRVVTERTRIGMPETGIGFVPDVGGTFLLSRSPGELGTHLALTAQMVSGADAIGLGLADFYLHSDRLGELLTALADTPAETAITALATDPVPVGELLAQRDWIDSCYAADDVQTILDRLHALGSLPAEAAAALIEAKSPTALAVTLESLRRARASATLEEVLAQEYRVSLRMLQSPDFVEGIRAQVIDKDRAPAWNPPTLGEVSTEARNAHFASLGPAELMLENHPARPQRRSHES